MKVNNYLAVFTPDSTKGTQVNQTAWPEAQKTERTKNPDKVMMGTSTLDDVMNEFRMNGVDSPYDPEENEDPWINNWYTQTGPTQLNPQQYAREFQQMADNIRKMSAAPKYLINELLSKFDANAAPNMKRVSGGEPCKVCRFCRNNGERELFYKSHTLKDATGRVTCPVLRKFTCTCCGASGDFAHTIKYCPYSTEEDRMKSSGLLRTTHMASGRRRFVPGPRPSFTYDNLESTPSYSRTYVLHNNFVLDPLWAALEKELCSAG